MTDDEKFEAMMGRINLNHEAVLLGLRGIHEEIASLRDAITATRDDLTNTKGHVVYVMEDSLTLSRRIAKLEDEMRRRGAP